MKNLSFAGIFAGLFVLIASTASAYDLQFDWDDIIDTPVYGTSTSFSFDIGSLIGEYDAFLDFDFYTNQGTASSGITYTYDVSYSVDDGSSWTSLGSSTFPFTNNPSDTKDDDFSASFGLNLSQPAESGKFWVLVNGFTLTPAPPFQAVVLGGIIDESASLGVTAVPVPAAVWLLGTGLIGLVGLRRKLR